MGLKTIQRKDFQEVGSAVKVHGTKGELKFNLTQQIKLKEWAFLEFRGKPVPFYIEHKKAEFEDEVILKLRGINTIEQAELYLGRTLLLPPKQIQKSKHQELDLIGFSIVDHILGNIGTIVALIENPLQILATVRHQDIENLVPLADELIEEIDEKEKIIYMNLPEGLLEIGNKGY